jgi:hypothetical protein
VNVELRDILTVVLGLVIVIVIALATNPHYLNGSPPGQPVVTAPVTGVPSPVQAITSPAKTPVPTPSAAQTSPLPAPAPPYRIFYTDKPFTYPNVKLPERMDTIGESDIPRPGEDVVTFAYIEDTRGGLSTVFSIPYPVWEMNITVNASRTPQLGNFRMALCYARNGTVIDGTEVLNQGNAYKKIQTSNTDLYLIVSTANIDRYRIDFQTSRFYYDHYRPATPGR